MKKIAAFVLVLFLFFSMSIPAFADLDEGDFDNWEVVCGYWNSRQLVQITDEGGNVWPSMRVVVKSYQYVSRFPKAVKATLEFWRL